MKNKFDSTILGTTLGIGVPVICFFSYYLVNYRYMGLSKFLDYITFAGTTSALVSLCVLANLALFFIFIKTEKYLSAKGILLATFIYAGIVCYLKFFTASN